MVCLHCGKHQSEFKSESKFQEHLNRCGSGIKYDLKIQRRLNRQAKNTLQTGSSA